jgi:PBS lyase HEAT-like repeat
VDRRRRSIVNDQVALRQQLIAHLKAYFPLLLQLFGDSSQLSLLLAMLGRWSDPRKLRRADRQLVDRVLREGGIKKQERRDELIARIRDAKLLINDAAIIEPLSMVCELLGQQIEASRKTVAAFDQEIEQALKNHPDGELFLSLRGAGPTLAARLLCAFGSSSKPMVRYEAAFALGEIQDPIALEALEQWTGDTTMPTAGEDEDVATIWSVRQMVQESIRKIKRGTEGNESAKTELES